MARKLELSPNDARAILEYDRWTFDRFARRIRRLPWKEVTRHRGIGHESLFRTLVHVLNVHEVWFLHIVRGRGTEKLLGPLFKDETRHPNDWKGFDAYSERVWAGIEETLRGWTPRSMGRKVHVFWMPGTYTVRDAVFQTTFEQAHHFGEIIGALWQDDVGPLDMMWIPVRRGGPVPRRRR
jgi:uncharacterized damage-inducible protein DinB